MIIKIIESIGRTFITLMTLYSFGQLTTQYNYSAWGLFILGTIMFTWILIPTIQEFDKQWNELNEPKETKIELYNGSKRN